MFCNQCGAQVPEGQLTCPVCGAYVESGTQQNVYKQAPEQNVYMQTPEQNANMQASQMEFGMKWFHFVIYFQLFAATLSGLWSGWRFLSGSIYNLTASQLDQAYAYYSGLKELDIFVGVLYIILGIFALVTRFVLAGFKKAGPVMYNGMQLANIMITIVYAILAVRVSNGEIIISPTAYSSLAVSVVMLICNLVYFHKRKELFIR